MQQALTKSLRYSEVLCRSLSETKSVVPNTLTSIGDRKVYGLRLQHHTSSRLSGFLKLLSLRLFDCRTEVDESIIYCTNPKAFMLSPVALACNPVESVSILVCWLCTSGRLSTSCSLERNSNSMVGSDELNPWFIHNAYAAFSFSHCDD